MDETGIWDWIGLVVELVGLALVLPAGIMLYRNSIGLAERRRAAGVIKEVVPDREALRLLQDPPPGALEDENRLRALRIVALGLRSRRALIVFVTALFMFQIGVSLINPSPWRLFLIPLVLFYLVAAVRVERHARVGAAFLRRYPEDDGYAPRRRMRHG